MADIVDPATRSRMMSGIRGRNTKIEVTVRKALFARGFRYRIDSRKLPGRPDMVFPRYGAVVFMHGCFWHGHDCPLYRLPSSNTPFWEEKIGGNRARDLRNTAALEQAGWRIAIVWECALRGKGEAGLARVTDALTDWLQGQERILEMRGG